MSGYQEAHNAGCGLCRSQLASPRPYHDDLCCFDITPGDRRDGAAVVQCPHLAVPGRPMGLCPHHAESAAGEYARITEQTAPFN